MKQLIYILSLVLLFSCEEKPKEVVWLNEKGIVESKEVLYFVANELEDLEQCLLYSAVQPIVLNFKLNGDSLKMQLPKDANFIEGKAHLVLTFKQDVFVSKRFNLIHSANLSSKLKDYRSPKTVITDSSLNQQSLIYTVDEHRNLLAQDANIYVIEKWKSLSPKTAIYRSDEDAPETSYYVLAGSVVSIQLMKDESKPGSFMTNKLKDKYGNAVAEGTKAVFNISTADAKTSRIETSVLDGMIRLTMPSIYKPPFAISVSVNSTSSNTLNITSL